MVTASRLPTDFTEHDMSFSRSRYAMATWLALSCGALLAAPVEKLLNRTLFVADENDYRYSEAAVLPLDDTNLLLVVSVFGDGGHDSSPAQLLAWRSNDRGRSWGESFAFQSNIGKQNVMSPSFVRLSEREILFFFLVTNSIEDAGMWIRRSLDNGKTWSKPVRIPYEGYGGVANDHVVLLKSGRIVLPSWVSRDSLASSYSYCFYSDDKGQTWKKSNEITVNKPSKGRKTSPAAEEPAVVELKDGRLLMLMRTYVGSFYRSFSTDGGETWSEPTDAGIPAPGAMPTLVRIPKTGDLLLLFNYGEPDEIDGPLASKPHGFPDQQRRGREFFLAPNPGWGPGLRG